MNRFLKAGSTPAFEFLAAKYAGGGLKRGLDSAVKKIRSQKAEEAGIAVEDVPHGLYTLDSFGRVTEIPTPKTERKSPLQSLSEQDINLASKSVGMPFIKHRAKVDQKYIKGYVDDALDAWKNDGGSDNKEKFIDRYMDYGIDFDELDDLIFAVEKIPANMRAKVIDGEWPAYDNLRMGYYHAIEEALRKKIK